jgi:hypothetical protein
MQSKRASVSWLVGVLVALVCCSGNFREDEVRCEDALAHLVQCCPGFDPHPVSCVFSSGCGTQYPALRVDESTCIESSSCDTLKMRGVCDRAQQARAIFTDRESGSDQATTMDSSTLPVCP